MKVFLVCHSTGGAHESSGVFSVWSTKDVAIAEARRLSALYNDEIEIAEVDMDVRHNEADVTFAPPHWRVYSKNGD